MRITFVANQCVPFHAASLSERPLGGTETAVIRLSDELHARGHEVTVFTPHQAPLSVGPRYIALTDANLERMPICDVLIAVREWKILMSPAHAELRLFWTGDAHDAPTTFGIGDPRVARRIDAMMLNSDWHARELCGRAGISTDKAWIIGCGVHMRDFAGAEPRGRKRLIYSSTPVRGLVLLPRIYERVASRHPDAELHVFAGFGTYRQGPGGDRDEWNEEWRMLADTLSALPGCTVHGNVLQHELAREFMRSSILAYPNTFNETFCVTAAEAQAAGCAIVTSDRAALPETVGQAGILVAGLPGSRAYEDDFVAALERLLTDDAEFLRMTAHGRARAHSAFDWAVIAAGLERRMTHAIEQKRRGARTSRAGSGPDAPSRATTGGRELKAAS